MGRSTARSPRGEGGLSKMQSEARLLQQASEAHSTGSTDNEGDGEEPKELEEFAGSGAGSEHVVPAGSVESFLLSCGADGIMRVWHIQAYGGKLLATLSAAQGRYEQVGWLLHRVCCTECAGAGACTGGH